MKTGNNTTPLNHNSKTYKSTLLSLGLCLAILAIAASPAHARSVTGFSGFRVWENTGVGGDYKDKNPLPCLLETFGAVFNNCKYAVGLEFDLPVDNDGGKSINVQNYWGGTNAEESFDCGSWAYAGTGPSLVDGTTISFTGPAQTLTTTVEVAPGSSIQLICKSIPPGGGIANITWNQ